MTAGRKKTDKRGKGRPTASQSGVGREALISAARELLQELPPAQVTSTAIARRANADPALVRYYFGNRENLLFEVAKQIGAEANRPPPDEGDPIELLADMIHNTFRFTRSAKHMQRLMIEELELRQFGRSARKDARMEPPAAVQLRQAAGTRRRRQAAGNSIRCSCTWRSWGSAISSPAARR